jgi:cerevisin
VKNAADAKKGKRKGFKGSVANMSLGGGKSPALDAAVNGAVDVGMHFAVAAGNDNADACKYSPAAAEKAVTVGATQMDDSRASFSNYGKCTDIFGPGVSIQSCWIGSKYATNTISGTSMASPHVCGLLAYLLSLQPAEDSEYSVAPMAPAKLKKEFLGIATKNAITDVGTGSPNLLAWNGGGCSNYSAIIEAGSYDAKVASDSNSKVIDSVTKLEKAIEDDLKVVSSKFEGKASSFESKAEKFAQKMHDTLEEFEHYLDEMTS